MSIGLKLSINDNKNVSIQMNNNAAIMSNNIVDVNCSSVVPTMTLPQQQQQQHNQLTSVVTVIAPKVEHPIIARPVTPDGMLSYVNNESVTSNKKIKM